MKGQFHKQDMNDKLEKHLQEKYPFMTVKDSYCGYEPKDSPMDCQCDDGWYQIVDDLCAEISKILSPQERSSLRIMQVKEKFGELRFYFNGVNDVRIHEAIEHATERSKRTCEVCGESGSIRTDRRWVQALCDKHAGE